MVSLQGCRVAKGAADVTLHFILGRKIELLEEFWRDRDTAGSPNLAQRGVASLVLSKMEGIAI